MGHMGTLSQTMARGGECIPVKQGHGLPLSHLGLGQAWWLPTASHALDLFCPVLGEDRSKGLPAGSEAVSG